LRRRRRRRRRRFIDKTYEEKEKEVVFLNHFMNSSKQFIFHERPRRRRGEV